MEHIFCSSVTANEEKIDHGEVTLQEALQIFDNFPWAHQSKRSAELGVSGGISFGVGKVNDFYLNIAVMDTVSVMIMMEAVIKPGFLGILFRKAASLDKDLASLDEARVCIEKFFKLDKNALYDWMKTQQSYGADRTIT